MDDPNKNDFKKGATDVFPFDGSFEACWKKSKRQSYFVSIIGNDGWKPSEVNVETASNYLKCRIAQGSGWIDNDQPGDKPRERLTCSKAFGKGNCPSGWLSKAGKCYKAFDQMLTYDQAKITCSTWSGILAEPRSSAENSALVEIMRGKSAPHFWLGLNDKQNENK